MVSKYRRQYLIICTFVGFSFLYLYRIQPAGPSIEVVPVAEHGQAELELNLHELNQRLGFLEGKLTDADENAVKIEMTNEKIQHLQNQLAVLPVQAEPPEGVDVVPEQETGQRSTTSTVSKTAPAEPPEGVDVVPEQETGQRSTTGTVSKTAPVTLSMSTTVTESKTEDIIGVLVIACNRPEVTKCLDKLLEYRPSPTKFPIVLSQACGTSTAMSKALKPYESKFLGHIYYQPNNTKERGRGGYDSIAKHYGWALKTAFETFKFLNLIIVEDDLEVALDFFEYFSATLPILKADPTLYCVSAWNDNGKVDRVDLTVPEKLYRTDFFPGLGWMLTRELWDQVGPTWPTIYWDDYMRLSGQRRGRACIRPEISRTFTFGRVGASGGMYYNTHLKWIKLNDKFVPFTTMDLSYLIKENYDPGFLTQVNSATLLKSVAELGSKVMAEENSTVEYRIEYKNATYFKRYAKELKIMEDFWFGVPRMGYYGIVPTFVLSRRLFLVPKSLNRPMNQTNTR